MIDFQTFREVVRNQIPKFCDLLCILVCVREKEKEKEREAYE